MLLVLPAMLLSTACAQPDPPRTVEAVYLGLSSGPLAQAVLADLPNDVVLQSGDIQFTGDRITETIAAEQLPPDEQKALEVEALFVLEKLATEPLLEREATAWAETQDEETGDAVIDAYLQHIADGVVVDDDDVRAFYDENTTMFGGASFDEVKGALRPMVLQQKRKEAVYGHINGLSARNQVKVHAGFVAEIAPKALDNPVDHARRSGRPTFVDFGAQGCQACDMMEPIIADLSRPWLSAPTS